MSLSSFGIIRRKNRKDRYALHCLKCRNKLRTIKLSKDINYYYLKDKFNKIKARAKKDNLPFNITQDYFISTFNSQNGKCFYFGIHLFKGDISVDRIDPFQGYTQGNIVFCSVRANTIKSNLTLPELKLWIPKFYAKIRELTNG